jgi:hypothetical protein
MHGCTTHSRVFLVLTILAVCALVSLSCGPAQPEGNGPQAPVAEATQPPTAELTQTLAPAAEPTQTLIPTATPQPTDSPPQVAGLDSLASYRMQINWLIVSADGSTSTEANTLEERVRVGDPAMHLVAVVPNMAEPGASITAETIYIGDTAYALQPDGTWLEMQMQGWEETGSDFWPVDEVQDWTAVGEETVDGVSCRHYTFRQEIPPEGERTLPVLVEGELWVTDQPDLPSVIVRQWVRWEGEGSPVPFAGPAAPGEVLITTLDARLSDLNAPIAIEAPAMPTPTSLPPTATPLPPPPTATPSPIPTLSPAPEPQFVQQPSYTGDCKQRPAGTVCLGFDDGYIWLVSGESVVGWAYGEPWQGQQVQIVQGVKADYHHVLGTLLVKVVTK